MATNSRTGGSTPPDVSNLGSSLADAFTQADNATAAHVQQVQMVYLARASQLSRTADELKAQYGANDAGVKRAEAALASARAASSQVAMLHQRFTTPDPSVAPDGWVLHGRVSDESRKAIAGFTVFFADAAKAYQQAYGFSPTDETGYFLLRFDGSRAASSDKAAAAKEARATELFVEVTDLKGRLTYLSDTAFQRVVGAAVYQDIVLTQSASTKGEPPAQVRKVSMPKREPK
jgi:hypothetical protein